jgi:hypothetical protein
MGLGITTAIFDGLSAARPPESSTDTMGLTNAQIIRPYHAVWWFATASAGSSLLIVWALKLGTQGDISVNTSPEVTFGSEEKLETAISDEKMEVR